jgi:hypothetical protein
VAGKSENRYSFKQNRHDDLWTVFDIFSGLPAQIDEIYLTHCRQDEAQVLSDFLNLEYRTRRAER